MAIPSVPLWINGKEVEAASTFDVVNPNTGQVCWKASSASKEDALRAVETAQEAFEGWSKTSITKRRDIILKAADLLEAGVDEYAGFMHTEMGCDLRTAKDMVIPLGLSLLRDVASRISSVCGSAPVCESGDTSCIVYKEPYGVILGIAPWNVPYIFAARAVGTAIATGNTTVLKGSELSPRSYWAFGKVLTEAGVPPGVVNIIYCRPSDAPEVVTSMIEHPSIRKINFTGSTNTGRQIAKVCGLNLKPCLMELGGKNSVIVLPDADIGKAAKQCAIGGFFNAGQICMATDRVIVHSEVAPKFLEAFKKVLAETHSSDTPVPSVISQAAHSRLSKVLSSALEQGAEVVYEREDVKQQQGNQFPPRVLGNVKDDMDVWQEELFGPLLAYTTVDSEEEAIRVANSSGFGLSAAIFTEDLRKALRIARKIESGAVHINAMTIHDEPTIPHGGVKNSGWGRFNAASGMEEFLVQKAVTWDN